MQRMDQVSEFKEKLVAVNRVTKVVKGGRNFRFSALVVVGDEKGRVGAGMGKAAEISEAIRKGTEDAKKHLINVPVLGTSIPHESIGRFGTGKVVLLPAPEGTGVIAGGAARAVLELAGIRDIRTKSYGTNNKINMVKATLEGLKQLRSAEDLRFAEEEQKLLEERLRFVRQLYQDTLEDKRSFRRQILGRRDSFGKVYAVTKALDAAPAQELPRKIVEVLEDVLENHSAAVYRVDARRHLARRAACSADFAARCPQLLEGTGLGPVLRGIEQDGLWVNRELTPGLPMFGAAVRENGELRALILLHDAAGEQLSLYYQNMFRILCGLAETAMVRAGTKPAAKQEVRV